MYSKNEQKNSSLPFASIMRSITIMKPGYLLYILSLWRQCTIQIIHCGHELEVVTKLE